MLVLLQRLHNDLQLLYSTNPTVPKYKQIIKPTFCPPFLLTVFDDLRSMIAAGYNIVVIPVRRPKSPWVNLFEDTHIARLLLDQTKLCQGMTSLAKHENAWQCLLLLDPPDLRVHRGLDHLGRINCYEPKVAEKVGMDLMADRKFRAREGSPALCPFKDDQDEADPGSC